MTKSTGSDTAPAEIAVESKVRYPYVAAIDPTNPRSARRPWSAAWRRSSHGPGETKSPSLILFDGPVFDAQTSIALDIRLAETDFYPAAGINENALSPTETLGTFTQEVPLWAATTPSARPMCASHCGLLSSRSTSRMPGWACAAASLCP